MPRRERRVDLPGSAGADASPTEPPCGSPAFAFISSCSEQDTVSTIEKIERKVVSLVTDFRAAPGDGSHRQTGSTTRCRGGPASAADRGGYPSRWTSEFISERDDD